MIHLKKAEHKVADETNYYKSPKTGFCNRGPIAIHERLEITGNMITHNCNLRSLFKAFAV